MIESFFVIVEIAELISLKIQVTESLINFYISYKDQDIDTDRTTTKLKNLLNTFQLLDDALNRRIFRSDEQNLLKQIESSAHKCDELIQELMRKCEKLEKISTIDIQSIIKVADRRATYSFLQRTLTKLDEAINEIRYNLSLALIVLQLENHKLTHDDIAQVKSLLEIVRANQVS